MIFQHAVEQDVLRELQKSLDFYLNSDYNGVHPNSDERRDDVENAVVLTLYQFNQAHKRMNVLYHNYARSIGLSDAAFWLLYSLYEHGSPCTQKELSRSWFYPPQTINSAIKALTGQGMITLRLAPGSKKNKQILFTEKGDAFVRESIAPLVQAEENSFEELEEQERELLLSITQKHIGFLAEEINRLIQMPSEDGSSQ